MSFIHAENNTPMGYWPQAHVCTAALDWGHAVAREILLITSEQVVR